MRASLQSIRDKTLPYINSIRVMCLTKRYDLFSFVRQNGNMFDTNVVFDYLCSRIATCLTKMCDFVIICAMEGSRVCGDMLTTPLSSICIAVQRFRVVL